MDDRTPRRVLIIDDNAFIHDDFRKILANSSDLVRSSAALDVLDAQMFGHEPPPTTRPTYELSFALQGEEACRMLEQRAAIGEHYALAFVDMRMPPGWDGAQTITRIWEIDPHVQVVICSAYSQYSWERILGQFGARDGLLILKKPFDSAEVSQLACALSEKWLLARQAKLKVSQLESMVEEQTRDLKASNERLRHEILDRTAIETALRVSENRYALAAAGANGGLWDWDLVAGTIYYAPRWKSLCGHEEQEIGTAPSEWLQRVHPEELEVVQKALRAHLAGNSPHFQCEYRMRHKDGRYRWMHARGMAVRDEQGHATRIAGSQNDVTDQHLAEEQLRHDALHDALTGLPNRNLLSDRLRQCLVRARRDPSQRFAVAFVDVDHFKLTNDTLGHLAGDQLLIEVGQRLLRCVRASDAVAHDTPGHSPVGRFGGDEFVVLLEGMRHDADAIRVVTRLQNALTSPFVVEGKEIVISISLGLAFGRPEYTNPEELLRDADTALHQAKANGRACYAVFDLEMHAAAMSRWWIESELRSAIERNELRLVYQPVVSLVNGQLCEFEVLLRWQHSTRGAISPAEFIPIAEQSGLIVAIGAWVLRSALTQLRAWDDLLGQFPDFALAINVSGKQVPHPDFLQELTALMHATGVPSRRLRLELTESAFMAKGLSEDALARMDALDLRFHLDDFGTGYSSLSYLHRLPVEALKIDISFVREMINDPTSLSIVESIVLLAHALGAYVIAEGVETQEQAERLRALNCDMAQGYLFSRPLELAAATEFLASAHSAGLAPARRESARLSFEDHRRWPGT